MKVKSTIKPKGIETDEYSVYINTDITETVCNGMTMYEYSQQRYDKDEYIRYLNEQLTNMQLALVEMYEGGIQDG